jgi:hypothetical protein
MSLLDEELLTKLDRTLRVGELDEPSTNERKERKEGRKKRR